MVWWFLWVSCPSSCISINIMPKKTVLSFVKFCATKMITWAKLCHRTESLLRSSRGVRQKCSHDQNYVTGSESLLRSSRAVSQKRTLTQKLPRCATKMLTWAKLRHRQRKLTQKLFQVDFGGSPRLESSPEADESTQQSDDTKVKAFDLFSRTLWDSHSFLMLCKRLRKLQ